MQLLVDRVARWAEERPGAPAYTFVDYGAAKEGVRATLTWAEADRRARALAVRLRESVPPGERAAVIAPQGLEYVIALLGAFYARVIAVPLFSPDLPGHADRLVSILGDAGAACALTTTAGRPAAERFFEARPDLRPKELFTVTAHELTEDTVLAAEGGTWRREEVSPDDIAYLQYTSGSTRVPAGVEITHRNLTANAGQLYTAFDARPGVSKAVLWLPLFHDMGLIATLALPAVAGDNAIFTDPVAFIMHPVRWLKLLSEHRSVYSGGPNFAYEYCVARITEEQRRELDLSGVEALLNGAEPVRPRTLTRFYEAFARCGLRREAMTPGYGLAEATVFVAAQRGDAEATVTAFDRDALAAGRAVPAAGGVPESVLVSVGRPGGQHVAIASADGVQLPDGEVGEIWVHGPNVAMRYWRNAEKSADTFGAALTDPGELPAEPWLRTGDLGVMYEGELYVTGRIKDLIIVDGRNHYPQDVEFTVQEAHEAIRRDHVAAFSVPAGATEGLVVIAERSRRAADHAPEEVAAAVRRAVSAAHEVRVHDLVLVEPGGVPRTSSGKIARRAGRKAYLEGTLPR